MKSIFSPGSLSIFENVRRGDPAPDWVRLGICQAWSLAGESVEITLIALSENVTFKVAVGSRPEMVVRLGRPGYAAGIAHVESELLWVEAVQREAGIATPSSRRGADDALVQFVLDDAGNPWTAVAFDFVTGVILEEQSDFAEHFVEIGRLTAQLHEQSRAWERPAGFQRFTWGLDDLTGPAARWGDWTSADLTLSERNLLAAAEGAARDAMSDVPRSPDRWGLIHSDLRPSNIMTSGSGLTIIDFDDCGDGYFLYDYGSALTFYEHRPEARAMSAAWLDGYEQVSRLTKKDLSVATALSMMRRLTMLGWASTHRSDALPADLWQENQPGTLEVAERYLADPFWLVG